MNSIDSRQWRIVNDYDSMSLVKSLFHLRLVIGNLTFFPKTTLLTNVLLLSSAANLKYCCSYPQETAEVESSNKLPLSSS